MCKDCNSAGMIFAPADAVAKRMKGKENKNKISSAEAVVKTGKTYFDAQSSVGQRDYRKRQNLTGSMKTKHV